MIIRDIEVSLNQKQILNQIDCQEDNDIYEEVLEEYQEIADEILALCEPVVLMERGEIGSELAGDDLPLGTKVLYVVYSVGAGPSQYSTKAFTGGDYLKGMLADAMADSALFSMEPFFEPYLREMCAADKLGISRRMEAPQDIPMIAQKIVYEKTRAKELCGMGISSGYMLDPLKSNAIIYQLTTDQDLFMHQHNCRTCTRYDCKTRNVPDVPIKVMDGKETYRIMVGEKQSILDALVEHNPDFTAVCGGAGRCGKCGIRVMEGYLPANSFDEKLYTKEEQDQGTRLSCKAYPDTPLTIKLLFQEESEFMVVSDYQTADGIASAGEEDPDGKYGIAIDIGTTTVAVQLISLPGGAAVATHSFMNHQRNYGADVISRIKASTEGKKDILKESICSDLAEGIRIVAETAKVKPEQIESVTIGGNTTMGHLLMGYDCKGLGEYPFTPVNISLIEGKCSEILGDDFLDVPLKVIPGISTYVGGDIVSGMYSCGFQEKKKCCLLIDLGTNGEVALGNSEKIFVTSTAAGPAFEGGNIQWGVGSIEGAISSIIIDENGPRIKTIGDKPPIGICGTGVLEAVSELVKLELVDETGILEDDYFDDGYPLAETESGEKIVITQKDIREIQLAKAAVRAGVETLFLRYGISKDEVETVYLAGGFGFKLDQDKAIAIGMLPEEFRDKTETVGNSSLAGAVKCLVESNAWEVTQKLADKSTEINLSGDADFNRLYMECMYFEEDE